jgi:hypothetical protein
MSRLKNSLQSAPFLRQAFHLFEQSFALAPFERLHRVRHLFPMTVTGIYTRTPFIRTLVIRITNYPDRLGLSCKSVENSTKLTCLEVTGFLIKYSTVLWLIELQIRRGRKVWTQVHIVNVGRVA